MYHQYDTTYNRRKLQQLQNNLEYANYSYHFYNQDATSLNPSLKNLQLSQNNLQSSQNNLSQSALNRSYDFNGSYPGNFTNNSNALNFKPTSQNEYSNYPSSYNQFRGNFLLRGPAYIQPNKRWSNYEYHLPYMNNMNEYIHNSQSRIEKVNKSQQLLNQSPPAPTVRQYRFNVDENDGKKLERIEKNKKRNFKIYANDKNESGGSFNTNTDVISSSDQGVEEVDESEYDAFEEYNRLFSKELNKETVRLLEHNQGCLSILIEGDIIEYVANEDDFEKDDKHCWAIYMGNSMIMRLDSVKKQIVYESYWKIANENYVYINKELDKKLKTLPIYETLYRARNANSNKKMFKKFSSDRNFAMWCRFDINKSDIDTATNSEQYSSAEAKIWLIEKFIESLDHVNEPQLKVEKTDKKKRRENKAKSLYVKIENFQ